MPKAKKGTKRTVPTTPKGKSPSLIGSSLGRPEAAVAGRTVPCSRCKGSIANGEQCFDIPQPTKPFRSTRRFCASCFGTVLTQTKLDLDELQSLVPGVGG
jgi:hypothetical protein